MIALTDEDRQILRTAAEEILTRGIYHGHFFGTGGKCCAIGALRVAGGDLDSDDADYGIIGPLWDALDEAVPTGCTALWNDERDEDGNYIRTAEEVAELFLNVADNAPARDT